MVYAKEPPKKSSYVSVNSLIQNKGKGRGFLPPNAQLQKKSKENEAIQEEGAGVRSNTVIEPAEVLDEKVSEQPETAETQSRETPAAETEVTENASQGPAPHPAQQLEPSNGAALSKDFGLERNEAVVAKEEKEAKPQQGPKLTPKKGIPATLDGDKKPDPNQPESAENEQTFESIQENQSAETVKVEAAPKDTGERELIDLSKEMISPAQQEVPNNATKEEAVGKKSGEKQDNVPLMEKITIKPGKPGAILEQLEKVPPTSAADAYNQAQELSNIALEKQTEQTQQSLPEIEAPTGLPSQKTRPAREGIKEIPLKTKPLSSFKSEKGGRQGREYQEARPHEGAMPPAKTGKEIALATGKSGANNEVALTKNAQNALEGIQLDTNSIPTQAGERPAVDITGEADPSQIVSFHNESNANVQQAKTEAAQEVERDFGENDIFPEEKEEKLKSKKKLSAPKKILAGKQEKALPLTPDVADSLNQTLSPALAKRIGEQKEVYDAGKDKFDKDSAQARANADREVNVLNQETRKQQQAEQEKAKADVIKYRQEFHNEQAKVEKTYQEKAAQASAEQRKKIQSEQQKGEAQASQHLAEAERKAEAEKAKAQREAGQKKAAAQKESKGFWGWVKSAAVAFIDGLKQAFNFIFDNLRKAVKGIFEAAKALVKSVIELARMAIVGYIKAFGLVLKGLVSVVFAAFPEIAKKINRKIDQAVNAAVKAVNQAADMLKKGVSAVFDFLANTVDSLMGLVQSLYNGVFAVIGMIIRGEFAELMNRLGYLVDAAKIMPEEFETAAYEELLGGNLDDPLSPAELAQAGITPPGFEGGSKTQADEAGLLPGPPWGTDNVGVDKVENDMEFSPELTEELLGLLGNKGEIEFGNSEEKSRTMAAVVSEATGEKSGEEQTQKKYPDDGLSPRQRAEVKWKLMKQGLAAWWEKNKVTIIAGSVAAIAGAIALLVVTGGSILGAVAPLMSILGPIFTGFTIATLGGYVHDYVSKSWNHDLQGGAKSLAKGLAAGAVEVITWLTFKAGEAAFKGAKALVKGGISLAKKTGQLLAKGAKFIIEKGKVLFKGIAGLGIGKRLKNLAELGKDLLARLRFKKFRIRFENKRFMLEGLINPWVLLATGEITYIEESLLKKRLKRPGRLEVGYKVESPEGIEGIVVGITKKSDDTAKRFVEEVLRPQSSEELIKLYKEYDKIPKNRLKTMLEFVSHETSENAAKLRANMEGLLGKKLNPGDHAHHIVPSTHTYKSAEEARKILKKYGIDINDAKNGVALTGELHSGLHTYKYMDKVLNFLNEADATNDINEIIDTLKTIGKRIENGKL